MITPSHDLITYLAGKTGEAIAKLVYFKVQLPNNEIPVFGCVTTSGDNILPTFYDDDQILILDINNGVIDLNVGDFAPNPSAVNILTGAGVVVKNCGGEVETEHVFALLTQMVGEQLEVVVI